MPSFTPDKTSTLFVGGQDDEESQPVFAFSVQLMLLRLLPIDKGFPVPVMCLLLDLFVPSFLLASMILCESNFDGDGEELFTSSIG